MVRRPHSHECMNGLEKYSSLYNNRVINVVLCFLIIFIGVLFRIYNINFDAFWWDEILSFWVADPEISLRESLLRHNQLDSTPPTFNVILKYFYEVFGYKINVGRYLSAIL